MTDIVGLRTSPTSSRSSSSTCKATASRRFDRASSTVSPCVYDRDFEAVRDEVSVSPEEDRVNGMPQVAVPRWRYHMVQPPSTTRLWPVIQAPAGEASRATAPLRSSGAPVRGIGWFWRNLSTISTFAPGVGI